MAEPQATIYGYPMKLTVDVDGSELNVTDCLRTDDAVRGTVKLDVEMLSRKVSDYSLERHRNRPEPRVAYYETLDDFEGFGP